MTLPLLPSPGLPPRWCRACHRPVPKGPLVGGLGSSCARDHGLTPPPQPRMPKAAPQEGPTLLDWQTECPPEKDTETADGNGQQ